MIFFLNSLIYWLFVLCLNISFPASLSCVAYASVFPASIQCRMKRGHFSCQDQIRNVYKDMITVSRFIMILFVFFYYKLYGRCRHVVYSHFLKLLTKYYNCHLAILLFLVYNYVYYCFNSLFWSITCSKNLIFNCNLNYQITLMPN